MTVQTRFHGPNGNCNWTCKVYFIEQWTAKE